MYKADVKRFFQDELYVALEYGFINNQYHITNALYTIDEAIEDNLDRDITLYQFESADFQKTVNMYNVKFGIESNSRKYKKLLFEYFIGVGIRKVTVNYSNVIDPKGVIGFPQVSNPGKDQGHTYGVLQPNGTYVIAGIDQDNPPAGAEDLGENAQGTPNPDGTYNVIKRFNQAVWDISEGTTWRGNFTFGVKIGYTLWSKQKHLYRH